MLSPAVATTTLSDPGPLCAGQTAVLTCSVADGVAIEWFYRDGNVGQGISLSQPPSSDPVTVGGVQFTLTLSQSSNPLISQLSFTVSPDMDGSVVRCRGGLPDGTFPSDEITLQVEMICKSGFHLEFQFDSGLVVVFCLFVVVVVVVVVFWGGGSGAGGLGGSLDRSSPPMASH